MCERGAALELAAAYEASERAALDALERLAVAERCFRSPPGQVFEVAEVVAGPLTDFGGLRFYVVRIDTGDGRSLFALTWPRWPLPVQPSI